MTEATYWDSWFHDDFGIESGSRQAVVVLKKQMGASMWSTALRLGRVRGIFHSQCHNSSNKTTPPNLSQIVLPVTDQVFISLWGPFSFKLPHSTCWPLHACSHIKMHLVQLQKSPDISTKYRPCIQIYEPMGTSLRTTTSCRFTFRLALSLWCRDYSQPPVFKWSFSHIHGQ